MSASAAARWTWIVSTVAATGAALVLAFVLSLSTRGGGFYERHFVWLFWVNVAVAGVLVLVIGLAALRLAVRARRGKFGSRLLIKLVGIFTVVGLLPGLVIYTVSYQFVSRSIEAWFDVRVASNMCACFALQCSISPCPIKPSRLPVSAFAQRFTATLCAAVASASITK